MRFRGIPIAAAAVLLCFPCATALATRQLVAMYPLQNLADNTFESDVASLGNLLKEKLQDRLDIHALTADYAANPETAKRKARGLGATYVLTGAFSKIGRTVTLDLTLAAIEDAGKGRTVVATGADERTRGGTGGLPPAYARMAAESAARLKYLFFGDEVVGGGGGRRKIPKLAGIGTRSRNIPGNVVSVARMDTDRDGKAEVVAAYENGIAIYDIEGDDLKEEAQLADAGEGLIHVDAADLNRNGIAEIVAVRYLAGKAVSDIWEFDGNRYAKTVRDIPYFLRTVDLGKEGVTLIAQESDPVTIFKGPVFRLSVDRNGKWERKDKGGETRIPVPEGVPIYSFTPLRYGESIRFAVLGERDRLSLYDDRGNRLWEGVDSLSGTETAMEPAVPFSEQGSPAGEKRRRYVPNRMLAVDLDGDRIDELLSVNNLVTAGGFFESLHVYSNSEVLCFAQEGDSLTLAWRTSQAGASARDAILEFSRGSKAFRFGIAARDPGKLLGKFGEWRVIWMK